MHTPVLLSQALDALAVVPAGSYVDCTFGRGGHARAILERLGPDGRLLALDRDPAACAAGAELASDPRFELVHARFSRLEALLAARGRLGATSGVLMDLGVSSPQLDDPERGFSFSASGPLDMRMDPAQGPSCAEWLNAAKQTDIADCLWEYGEERYSRRIARAIVAARQRAPLKTTGELAALVAGAVPRRPARIHPATRTFQALRILINDELGELRAGLEQAARALALGGRLVVISFHSLEDRIVKRYFRELTRPAEQKASAAASGKEFRLVQRKPVTADDAEIARNPRARSANLRALERAA